MPDSYLPGGEANLVTWLVTYKNQLNTSGGSYGFDPVTEIPAIVAAIDSWIAQYYANVAAQDAARVARAAKDDGKRALLAMIRGEVGRLQTHPAMTDPARLSFGISTRDAEPTPAGTPATRPVLQIDISKLQQHIIGFADEGTPTQKAKPRGVHACRIYCKVGGAAPANDSEWTFLATDTATPYVNLFNLADIGTTVYYRAQWEENDGTLGEWSVMVQAKVPG